MPETLTKKSLGLHRDQHTVAPIRLEPQTLLIRRNIVESIEMTAIPITRLCGKESVKGVDYYCKATYNSEGAEPL